LKSIKEEGEEIEFAAISYSWDEDVKFLKDLFKKSVDKIIDLEKVIMGNLENWDINRIALTDKVILMVAISEMIEFPSIPVKVSINEYIDISKVYSTPKSKNFVNGMLDVISSKLFDEGTIKKSGRGLIDNK
jgi:N utilization substance protein B